MVDSTGRAVPASLRLQEATHCQRWDAARQAPRSDPEAVPVRENGSGILWSLGIDWNTVRKY